jgi:hypothetical protein
MACESLRVRQQFPDDSISDVAAAVERQLDEPAVAKSLKSGQKAAIAVGSRGIANLPVLVRALADGLRKRKVASFLVPAMGSHGGGTAEGQREVLARYGVTEASAGVPIRSDMATEIIGGLTYDERSGKYSTSSGEIPIHVDRTAWREADVVIPVVRIKPHTGFRGRVESGICKMLAIGLSKHVGCAALHRQGYLRFSELIPSAAQVALNSGKIPFSLAVVENAYEKTMHVEVVPGTATMQREPELLKLAKTHMPRILLNRVDVLVVEEIGKDISGTGMDGNVVGRSELGRLPDFNGPEIRRIVVLGLSKKTHGNATGIGLADIITEQAFQAIDRNVTYTNVLTSGSLGGGKIPVALADEERAIAAAVNCVPGVDPAQAIIVRIKNTLHLSEIAVSTNAESAVRATPGMKIVGTFDGNWSV